MSPPGESTPGGQQSPAPDVRTYRNQRRPSLFRSRAVTEDEFARLEAEDRKQHLRSVCAEQGLRVAEVRREGDVLVLVPETLASLPPADVLRDLSDRLTALGYRYVSLSVDDQ